MKDYSKVTNGTVIMLSYHEYMEGNEITDKDRRNSGVHEFDMEGKSLKGGQFSKHSTI